MFAVIQNIPWVVSIRSGSQQILCLLLKSKVSYCRVHKSLPVEPVVSQINPIRTLSHCFFNIVYPSV
jgi:hypothetical protein